MHASRAPRVGRGGKRGKTSGRGTKGQNARAGHKKRPESATSQEDPEAPRLRQEPFTHGEAAGHLHAGESFQARELFKAGDVVSPVSLMQKSLFARGGYILPVKILGTGSAHQGAHHRRLRILRICKDRHRGSRRRSPNNIMLSTFLHKLGIIFSDRALRNRVLFIVGALAAFRLLRTFRFPA
jgi:ribosomal protein L15